MQIDEIMWNEKQSSPERQEFPIKFRSTRAKTIQIDCNNNIVTTVMNGPQEKFISFSWESLKNIWIKWFDLTF